MWFISSRTQVFLFFNVFVCLFLRSVVMLALCCSAWAFSGGGRALGGQASGAAARRLSSFGAWA